MSNKLGVPLLVAFVLGLGWYVYPLRQQAIYFNECVEWYRAQAVKEGYAKNNILKLPLDMCNSQQI